MCTSVLAVEANNKTTGPPCLLCVLCSVEHTVQIKCSGSSAVCRLDSTHYGNGETEGSRSLPQSVYRTSRSWMGRDIPWAAHLLLQCKSLPSASSGLNQTGPRAAHRSQCVCFIAWANVGNHRPVGVGVHTVRNRRHG